MVKLFKFNFKNIFFLLILFSLYSCSDTYNDFQKVDDLKWLRSDIKTFEVDISNEGNYDLYFTFRHSTGYPFRNIGVKIEHITPDGEESYKEADFLVVNEEDEYKGDVIGMLWDIEELFSEKTFLKKGKNIFKISHIMNSDPVILVIDIGFRIKKS